MSDQTDSRLLVGLYRCTDIPGLLTRAVTQGTWLLIEDIDRAPADVLALLTPLVQTGELTVLLFQVQACGWYEEYRPYHWWLALHLLLPLLVVTFIIAAFTFAIAISILVLHRTSLFETPCGGGRFW